MTNTAIGDWSRPLSGLSSSVLPNSLPRLNAGELSEEFRRFKEARPPLYCTSWMYGGNVLLFYRAGEEHHADSETVIDGLGCKVWYAGSLGMHPRDLFLLADVLEDPGEVEDFQWESTSAH